MELLIERCAGLDVHKASVTATVRVPDPAGGRRQQTRSFRATTAGLVLLGDWLATFGVTVVGMESTGVYWRPVYYLLEDDFQCWLLNAAPAHRARAQARCGRLGVDRSAGCARPGPTLVRGAQADPGAARSAPRPHGADRRADP